MTYRVKLEVFEGPFDLLLHLIAKREVDIYEISLAQITEDYLDHIKAMHELDLEIATEFLVVAATLIEIKAARLIPGEPVDDEEALLLSERDMLIARLLEYRAFKDAADVLRAGFAATDGHLPRTAGPGREFDHLCPDLLARVSPDDLARLAIAALTPRDEPVLDLSHITPIRATVSDAIATVLRALEARPSVTFKEIRERCEDRIDVVVRFLAVLELIKRGQATVEQAENFGDIVISRSDSTPDPREVIVVDEYEGAPAEASAGEIDLTEANMEEPR